MTLTQARKNVNKETFGTSTWEAAMQIVRDIVAVENARRPAEEFCSVDSGFHYTRLLDGRMV